MKILFYIILIITILQLSCNFKSKKISLKNINHINRLSLVFEDDKCGEWGGDRESFIFYRENYDGIILTDYEEQIRNCKNPVRSANSIKEIKKIKVTSAQENLILESLNQLIELKLSHKREVGNSGLYSKAILSDSSFVLYMFPSKRWTQFETLKESLIKK